MSQSNCAPPPTCPFCGEPSGLGKPHAPDCQRHAVAARLRGSDRADAPRLAELADVVFDTVRMIQHAQPSVHLGSPQGVQLLVRGLAAAGVQVGAALRAERESPIQAQSIVVSAKLDGIATLMRNLMGHIERAALVHDDRFVAAMRETVQEIWRELEDMGARVSR